MFCAPNAKILTELSEKSFTPKNPVRKELQKFLSKGRTHQRMLHGGVSRKWHRFVLCTALACLLETAGSLQPLFAGQVTWKVDRYFNDGRREVTVTMSTAFVQSPGCSYAVGAHPQCVEDAACSSQCALQKRHGVLCVAQLVLGQGTGNEDKHWAAGDGCISELTRRSVDMQTLGGSSGANNFTITHLYDSGDPTSEFRSMGGERVVVGRMEKVITIMPEASALIVWLSALASNDTRPHLLLRQCDDADLGQLANTTACAVNANKTQLHGAAGAHVQHDPYWGIWGDTSSSRSTDQLESAALETYVPLCSSLDCSTQPVRNFASPVAVVPPLVEVAVTARTRKAGDGNSASNFIGLSYAGSDRFLAPHPSFAFKAFDSDQHTMVQYNPMSTDGHGNTGGIKNQRFEAACFLGGGATTQFGVWPQTQCSGGDHDGAPCNTSLQCEHGGVCVHLWSSCRWYSDFDANPNRRQVVQLFHFFGARRLSALAVVTTTALSLRASEVGLALRITRKEAKLPYEPRNGDFVKSNKQKIRFENRIIFFQIFPKRRLFRNRGYVRHDLPGKKRLQAAGRLQEAC